MTGYSLWYKTWNKPFWAKTRLFCWYWQ